MKKNSENISINEAMRLANSEAGQKLISLLKKQNPEQLQKAVREASGGNYQQASSLLSGALSSQEVQALLEQLRGQSHG
jgi:putative lipoic acid-binding regulatory protein